MGEKDELNRFFIGEKEIDTSGIPEFPGDLIIIRCNLSEKS